MKKILKKMTAVVLTAMVAVTVFGISAFAEEKETDTDTEISNNESETETEIEISGRESSVVETLESELQEMVSAKIALSFDLRNGLGIQSVDISPDMTFVDDPIFEDTNMIFAGWYTGIDGTGEEMTLEKAKELTHNTTVYAKWENGGKIVRTEALDCTSFTGNETNAQQGWTWDNDSKVLTLEESYFSNYQDEAAITLPDNSTIFTTGEENGILYLEEGIYCEGNLTIKGNGTLMVTADNPEIRPFDNGVSVENNLHITDVRHFIIAANGAAIFSSNGNIIIENSDTVYAMGKVGFLTAAGDIEVYNSLIVAGANGDVPEDVTGYDGIHSAGQMRVENSTVKSYGRDYAVFTGNGIVAPGGYINHAYVDQEGLDTGETKWMKRDESGEAALLVQDNRTIYYNTEDGKLYEDLQFQKEITNVPGIKAGDENNILELRDCYFGTRVNVALYIHGDCTLSVNGENTFISGDQTQESTSNGIYADGNLNIINEYPTEVAALYAVSGDIDYNTQQTLSSKALFVEGALSASDITLTASAGSTSGSLEVNESCGLQVKNNLTFNQCDVEAYAGNGDFSVGIMNMDNSEVEDRMYAFSINGGDIRIAGNDAKFISAGLLVDNLEISGGAVVKAVAGEAEDTSAVSAWEMTIKDAGLKSFNKDTEVYDAPAYLNGNIIVATEGGETSCRAVCISPAMDRKIEIEMGSDSYTAQEYEITNFFATLPDNVKMISCQLNGSTELNTLGNGAQLFSESKLTYTGKSASGAGLKDEYIIGFDKDRDGEADYYAFLDFSSKEKTVSTTETNSTKETAKETTKQTSASAASKTTSTTAAAKAASTTQKTTTTTAKTGDRTPVMFLICLLICCPAVCFIIIRQRKHVKK